jgi:formylglycine-generating enzyme
MITPFRFCFAAALLSLLAFTACKSKQSVDTAIIVEVTSDLVVPKEMNQVRVTGNDPQGRILYEHTFALGEGANRVLLPFRAGLYPLHDTSTPIHIEAVGQLDDTSVVTRSATLPFIHGRQIVLAMPLMAVCKPDMCTTAYTTCMADGSCDSDSVVSSTLPTYVANRPSPGQDAATMGPEVGTPMDAAGAAGDVFVDATSERGQDSSGRDLQVDEPVGAADAARDTLVDTAPDAQSDAAQDSSVEVIVEARPETGPDAKIDVPATTRCAGLAAICGPAGDGDCCTSLPVTGGTFYRSYDGVNYTDKSYPATVADFYLDKYEVTVGRFRQFVDAGKGTQASPPAAGDGAHPLISGSGWDSGWNTSLAPTAAALKVVMKCDPTYQTWTDMAGANESRPINCLDWFTAAAFCAWDGGRLATEAEWNYAAAGGSAQREYPWGSSIDGTKASYYDGLGCTGNGNLDCVLADLMVVGSKPAGNGRWGQSDLAGNVWEWTLDWYATYQSTCDNCANLTAASFRVARGGSYTNLSSFLRTSYRINHDPGNLGSLIGARCARSGL